jgi:hypothetical protein
MSRQCMKHPGGRPTLTGRPGKRYQVTIPPDVAVKLRKVGNGSLSRGVLIAAGLLA